LDETERSHLFQQLLKPSTSKWSVELLCVFEERTELLVTMGHLPSGAEVELSDVLEKAKSKAGKTIIKASGETYPPFYSESYDRIMRDDQEVEDVYNKVLAETEGDSQEEYRFLWISGRP
jgi:hypothetical protein